MCDLRLLMCRRGLCWMWDGIIFTRIFPLSSPFPPSHQHKIPRSSFLRKSKYPDGQRDGLSLTKGMDLLPSQMFEILPPACIIERNVLITLTWQLVRLPEPTQSRVLISKSQGKSLCWVHRKMSLSQQVLHGGSTCRVPWSWARGRCGSGSRLSQQKHHCHSLHVILMIESREVPRKLLYCVNSSVPPSGSLSDWSRIPKQRIFLLSHPHSSQPSSSKRCLLSKGWALLWLSIAGILNRKQKPGPLPCKSHWPGTYQKII